MIASAEHITRSDSERTFYKEYFFLNTRKRVTFDLQYGFETRTYLQWLSFYQVRAKKGYVHHNTGTVYVGQFT